MDLMTEHKPSEQSMRHDPPAPKRFRIVKLEERIAPGNGHGGATHAHHQTCVNCGSTTSESVIVSMF